MAQSSGLGPKANGPIGQTLRAILATSLRGPAFPPSYILVRLQESLTPCLAAKLAPSAPKPAERLRGHAVFELGSSFYRIRWAVSIHTGCDNAIVGRPISGIGAQRSCANSLHSRIWMTTLGVRTCIPASFCSTIYQIHRVSSRIA